MALGSKGGGGGGGGGRGRPYGMMLLLAFGVAVLGVMILHKLRDSRIYTLLIKDKDRELMSLHLLLQKERESTREMKRKFDELKTKTYSLRSQKLELGNKVAAIQSTISSLRDEVRALATTLDEKQNEIKMLRQKEIESSRENSQITALRELLKQKEAEIEEMKHLTVIPTKIWSVVTDDPSNPPVNLTMPVVSSKTEIGKLGEPNDNFTSYGGHKPLVLSEEADSKSASGGIAEIIHAERIENLDKGGNSEELEERRKANESITKESPRREEAIGGKNQGNQDIISRGEKDNNIEPGLTASYLGYGDANSESKGGNTMRMEREEHGIKLENREGGNDQLLGKISKDEMKLKKLERSGVIRPKARGLRGEYSHIRTNRRIIVSREATNPENGAHERNGGSLEGKGLEAIQKGGNSHQNESTQDHGNRLRPESGELESNNLKVGNQSKISGERNYRIFEHSMDKGLRTSRKPVGVIRQQAQDTDSEKRKKLEVANVMQHLEKTD